MHGDFEDHTEREVVFYFADHLFMAIRWLRKTGNISDSTCHTDSFRCRGIVNTDFVTKGELFSTSWQHWS